MAGAAAMRVIVADDSVLARAGVVALLTESRFEVVGVANNGDEAVALVAEQLPDVAVLDIRMPPTHTTEGLVAARTIRDTFPRVAVLVLSQFVEATYALELMSAYPQRLGYLLKERVVNGSALADTLTRLVEGECVIDPTIVQQLMRRRRESDPLSVLTEREKEVLEVVAHGHSNGGIARHLRISERTVETHVTQIFAKLGLLEESDMNRRVLAVLAFLNAAG